MKGDSIMSRSHSHANYRQSPCGRFIVEKSLHFGTRGPAGSVYVVVDSQGEFKDYHADKMSYVECYLHKRLFGRELAPWFGKDAEPWKNYGKISVPHPEWKTITTD